MAKKSKISSGKKLAVGLATAATLGATAFTFNNLPYFVGEKVVEVVDGDTIILANRQPVRLYGLDAPALEYCYGRQAKSALSSLVLGKKVILREPLSDGRGRVMALVYVEGKGLVNEYLVRNGFGVYRRQAGSETKVMKSANDDARTNKLGVFSSLCTQSTPPDPKCVLKGNIDDRSRKKEYLPPDCKYYAQTIVEKHMGEQWFCSVLEATAAGFSLASSCSPATK